MVISTYLDGNVACILNACYSFIMHQKERSFVCFLSIFSNSKRSVFHQQLFLKLVQVFYLLNVSHCLYPMPYALHFLLLVCISEEREFSRVPTYSRFANVHEQAFFISRSCALICTNFLQQMRRAMFLKIHIYSI